MSNPNYTFLATCLAGGAGSYPAAASQAALANPESLFSYASSEAILPSLYPSLSALGLLSQIPNDIAQSLEAVTQLNAERNRFIFSELHSVVAILNREGIQPLVLKGVAYLLTGVYTDLGSRYLYDVDLVIPEAQVPAAQCGLAQAAFRPDTHDAMALFRHHHVPLRRPGGISFELHHSLTLHRAARRILTISEMLSESTLLEWEGLQVRIPSPDHLAAHLILHSQIQHPYRERIWPPLRAMYDLQLLNRRYSLNWRSIERRFRAAGQHTTFKLHLLQVEKTLGMIRPLPISLGPLEKLRWLRRKLLNRWPVSRFIDPTYLCLSTLSRRFRVLRSVFATPGGWKSAVRMMLHPGFYHRMLGEITLTNNGTS